MSSEQQHQVDWTQCLSSILPRMMKVCSIYTNFQLCHVSKALQGIYEEFLPIQNYKFHQDAEDKDIYALLHACGFEKKKVTDCGLADENICDGEESKAKKAKVDDGNKSSTDNEILTVELNSHSLNLNPAKFLSLYKNIKISNGLIKSGGDYNFGIKIIDNNVKFSKVEFVRPTSFVSHGKPEISFENSCFQSAEFFPMSKGTIISIRNCRVVGKLVVKTTRDANIHIENCQAQIPDGNLAMESGMFHVSNGHIQNLLLKMY
eukprot:TRINITY_DN460_c1_g1_i10.p2 TRINITY_DN460_c1_g1~~TRINITY_DN460_c1_g1_i10.p2  ORF type:complete len:283 (+),score=35.84 TRINITY_DN460_c1_g1_i10:66-851(+)